MALSTIQQTLMGLLTPGAQAASGSIYDQARADAQRQMLAQLGMGLVGAAVPQTPLMRAQALQQAFSGVGNIGTGVYNAAQARLMAQKAEGEQRRAAALNEFFSQNPSAQTDAVSSVDIGGGFRGPQSTFGSEASVVPGSKISQIPAAERLIAPPPPTAQYPGGLTETQWKAVSDRAKSGDLEGADALYNKIVEKKLTSTGSETETYGTVMYVTDKATGLPQAVLPKKGGGYVPIAEPGQAIDPATLAGQKAGEIERSKLGAQEQAGATDAIDQANLNLQNIDTLLSGDAIDLAYGPYVGPLDPGTGLGVIENLRTGGKFGAAVALVDQIDFGSFAEGIKLFTGKGALSDAEGKVARGIKARLVRTQDPESAKQALLEFRAIVEAGKKRSELLNQINPNTGKYYTKAEAFSAVPALDPELGGETNTGTTQKAPSTSDIGTVPDGIDPEVWKFMTPEQRNLWK